MESNLRKKLIDLHKVIGDINHTSYLLNRSNQNKSDIQSNMLRLQYLKRKLHGMIKEVRKLLTNNLIKVTYSQGSDKFELTLSGLTKEDIDCLFDILNENLKEKINILEIKEIPSLVRIL